MFSEIEEIARVAQDNLRYVSLSLRGNMPFLVYNIKGKNARWCAQLPVERTNQRNEI